MGLVAEVLTSFTLGIAMPLSAVCVIPLYPGFLGFLSNQDDDAPSVAVLGVLMANQRAINAARGRSCSVSRCTT